ncbi:MAG: glutathione S-transferase, partial [Myxococcales bacterium]|nr:glutathione S-transferase [Myxococcales bacterium]
IPVLVDEDGTTLPDSNAILVYLARRYDASNQWLPDDAIGQARVQRWLSVAAGELAYGPAAARLVTRFGVPINQDERLAVATRLFGWLQAHLAKNDWLALDRPTLAELAMYAYLVLAPEGGFDPKPYPAVARWLARIEALPGFVPMQRSAGL